MTTPPVSAEKVREARELVERKGRRALGNGDYSVDPGWHIAAELLPIIDAQVAALASMKDALEEADKLAEAASVAVVAPVGEWRTDEQAILSQAIGLYRLARRASSRVSLGER